MSVTIEKQINTYFETRDKISREELLVLIKKDFANWSNNTINIYLSSLQKKGIIHSLSRGMYALGNEETFQPHLNNHKQNIPICKVLRLGKRLVK